MILPRGGAHVVRDKPGSAVTTIADLEPATATSWEVRGGSSGAHTELLCGGFVLENAHPLVASLPRIIRLQGGGEPAEWLRSAFSGRFRALTGESPMR